MNFKTLLVVMISLFSIRVWASDTEIVKSKDWRVDKVSNHKVSNKPACVAKTDVKGKDVSFEVYSEASAAGGYVEPMVQIVTTQYPTVLGVMLKPSPSGKEMPLSISLKETRMIEVEKIEPGSSIPVIQKVEQQVFVGKFKNKSELIDIIRAKNTLKATFVGQSGVLGQETISLSGSNVAVKKLLEVCL